MTCPKCGNEQTDGYGECLRCGVIFSRVHPDGDASRIRMDDETASPGSVESLLFSVPSDPNLIFITMKAFLAAVLLVWEIRLVLTPIPEAGINLLHYVNLPFHEAGHIFFRLFGEFFAVLGGSLFQLLMPLICCGALLFKTRDPFGASVALWWFGENFIDLAPYINDARALKLILLGGVTGRERPGFHDWENILGTLGLLSYDHAIACAAMGLGLAVMLAASAWSGVLLFREWSILKQGRC